MAPADRRTKLLAALVPVGAILLIAGYRMAPHPWNVAPVGALFVLSGLYVQKGWRQWALPFAAILLSDALVYLRYDGTLFHLGRLGDYAGFALILLGGAWAARRALGWRVAAVLTAPV